jgi:hypothetical protein
MQIFLHSVYLRTILILTSHLRKPFSSSLFPVLYFDVKCVWIYIFPMRATYPAHIPENINAEMNEPIICYARIMRLLDT